LTGRRLRHRLLEGSGDRASLSATRRSWARRSTIPTRAPIATVHCLGAARTVTGSKFLVEVDGRRLLVDCGLYQGLKDLRLRNWEPLPVDPARIDAVALTHAHIDHIGYLPRLIKDGFRGRVTATRGTADLARIMLPDSGHLQEEEAAYHNAHGTSKHTPALPLYTAEEGARAAEIVSALDYQKPVRLLPGVQATFRRAGHILGSASVRVDLEGNGAPRRLVFSGDIGRYAAPILLDPEPVGEADYVFVESTYGDRLHDPEPVPDQIERVVRAAVTRGAALVVPAFAVGRTQELVYHLRALEDAGRIPRLPTYVDSPMAIEATGLYCAHPEDLDPDTAEPVLSGTCPLHTARFKLTRSVEESRAINDVRGPAIIIAASGMATGGRILHHLRRRLPDPKTTVLLVGFQSPGTRGRLLQDGARTLRIFGEDVPVRARVEAIHGLSAHSDANGLLRWLRTAVGRPRHVFVVHGELRPADVLAARIRADLGWEASVPDYRDVVALD
jgi:metallo-beta-lactamase family protein